jgi:outer membrane protein OmpA-like peptidoglycan-associated protein
VDDDGDRVMDAADRCPFLPEDHDGFMDDDGCPDFDNDGDLLVDGLDPSPLAPEDWDDFEDIDGTPEPDNDADGFADAHDQCATVFGTVSGCPAKPPLGLHPPGEVNISYQLTGMDAPLIVGDTIHPSQPIDFEHRRAIIMPRSDRAIDGLSFYLKGNPHLARVEVGVHVDGRGSAYSQRQLSVKRAKAVAGALVRRGVAAERLYLKAYGGATPVASNKTRAGRAKNRRVEVRMMGSHERPARKARFRPPKLKRKKRKRREKGRKGLVNPRSSLAPDQPTILHPAKPIEFRRRRAAVSPESVTFVRQLATIVAANPEFRRIEVAVGSVVGGTRAARLAVNQARAEEVRRLLIGAGVDAARLIAKGNSHQGGVELHVVDAPLPEVVQ